MSPYWLLLIVPVAAAIGYFIASLCFVSSTSESESYWTQQYFLERESHRGTIKKYLNKLKEADETIHKLSEEKANLQDSLTYYKEAL